ncbi:unnamed protein product [Sphenostylis stenocarpa]|uniref:Uncharacterized protein n=1 Tax=Sphenostylis stenocarpa TaxID=92480 RepID=A0AA86T1U3_9FABA|nr:unnamed protein product [Sphenostylis stenocarpa]
MLKISILFSIIFAFGFLRNVVSHNNSLPYEAIFNFGDSISDTGNAAFHEPFPSDSPYGLTYFKHPAGRLSDGRLIIDFIAEAYGLPMLPAYLNLTKGQDIKRGVNFAYSGSTALDKSFFDKRGLDVKAAAYSLSFPSGKIDTFRVCCGVGEGYRLPAYRLIAKGLIEGAFAHPPLKPPVSKIPDN